MDATVDMKTCNACGKLLPITAFYKRASVKKASYVSECKSCMKQRSQSNRLRRLPADVPRVASEALALEYLRGAGIPSVPGKAFRLADVDVVAWGCVWVEVKYAALRPGPRPRFQFGVTFSQIHRGYLAHVIMLICDYGDKQSYHLFPSDHAIFYREFADGTRRVKSAVCYIPESGGSTKHGAPGSIIPTDALMKQYEGDLEIVERARVRVAREGMATPHSNAYRPPGRVLTMTR